MIVLTRISIRLQMTRYIMKICALEPMKSNGTLLGARPYNKHDCLLQAFVNGQGLKRIAKSEHTFLELGIYSISAILESYICFRNFYTLKK